MAIETVHSRTREGAAEFTRLLKEINEISESCLARYAEVVECGRDVRDYRAMANLVGQALRRNLFDAHPDHAQGFLRALTDLLCMEGDGFGPDDDWDPIRNTAAAFGEVPEVSHG